MSRNRWTYTNASSIGTSHLRRGEICQDHSTVKCLQIRKGDRDRFIFAAVSDGAGTAKQSAKGARLTIRVLRKEIQRCLASKETTLNEQKLRKAILLTANHIEEIAHREGQKFRDYAATLVCSILLPNQSWHLQIGDGAAVFGYGDQRSVGHWPAKGQYGNETYFITDENVLDHLYVAEIQPPDDVTLFTDGLEPLALNIKQQQVHDPFYNSFYKVLKQRGPGFQKDLATGLDQWMQTELVTERTDDDKSLVLVSALT